MTSEFQARIPLALADSLPSAHTRVAMRKALTTFFAFNRVRAHSRCETEAA